MVNTTSGRHLSDGEQVRPGVGEVCVFGPDCDVGEATSS